MRTAAEHFDWAVGRAMEYVELGDAGRAMASLVSDLDKHKDTAGILSEDLLFLFTGEVMIGGAQGARRFIEGLPRPVAVAPRPIVDANGAPVPNADPSDQALRQFMSGRVPADCGHYIAASEARAGFRSCEHCPTPAEVNDYEGDIPPNAGSQP